MLLSVDFHTPRVFFFGGRAYPCEVPALRTANGCHYVGMTLKEKKIELTVVAKLKKCWNLLLKYSERERELLQLVVHRTFFCRESKFSTCNFCVDIGSPCYH